MDDTARVSVRERRRDGGGVAPGPVPVERAGRDQRVERDTVDELQHEDGLTVALEHVVDADEVRMLETRERRGFPLEPPA